MKSIDDAGQVPWNAGAVARDLLLALLLLLLILFPSILFNSTLEEHYDEVRGWFRFGRDPDAPSRMAAVRRSPWFRVLAFVGFFALGALLYSFLDPTFGFSRRSLALFLGLLVGLLVITLIAEIPVILVLRKHADRGRIRLLAGSLVVGVVCVAVSRLAGFKPGYLYGLIAGAAFQRTLSKDEEGRSVLAGTIALLLTSVGAWLLWIPVSHAANQPGAGTWTLIFDAVLAAVFVTGLEAVFIGMLPLRFLDGHRMYVWNRVVWGVLFVVGAFGFVHLLLRPGSGYFQHSGNTPLFTILGLFLAFGVVSVSFWAYFAFRKPRESKEEAPETAVPPGSEPATE